MHSGRYSFSVEERETLTVKPTRNVRGLGRKQDGIAVQYTQAGCSCCIGAITVSQESVDAKIKD
jgi:hypothetical protein